MSLFADLATTQPTFLAAGLCVAATNKAADSEEHREIADQWFPYEGRASITEARKLCHGCPVISECLQWALDHEERDGIWGGTIPSERARVFPQRRAGRNPKVRAA